jgi:translation elongation factor P/translation initiation factor 5A
MSADFARYEQLDGRYVYVDLDTVVAVLDVFKADQRGPIPQIDRTKAEIVTKDGEHYFVHTPAETVARWVAASPIQRGSMLEELRKKEVAP